MHVVRDEGVGTTAVLLHGQPGLGIDFDRVVAATRRDTLRTLSVDRPGYGQSVSPATGFRGNADALAALLDVVAPAEQVLLLGYSWGGGVALAFGQTYPERLAGLVLAASVGAPQSLVGGDRIMASGPGGRAAARLLPLIGRKVSRPGGSALTPADRALVRKSAMRWGRRERESFRTEQRALITELPDLWESLSPRRFPITVIQGSRDHYVPMAAGQVLAARLEARYVEIPAGHLLPLEVPVLLAAELERFAVKSRS